VDVTFDLAVEADDAAIRRLLRENPVPGAVTVSYEREPSYFLGCSTMGHTCQVLVARHAGEIVGLACRATRPLFVNGEPEEVGYLGQLRVDRRFRGRWLLSRGFELLRGLHADGRVAGYVITVTEENREALGVLVGRPRRNFPAFREVGRLCTLAIVVRRRRLDPQGGLPFDEPADASEVAEFLGQHGRAKQFFPVYAARDFGGARARGFSAGDFVVVRRGGAIAGVLGLWDQSAYKQTVVRGYGGLLGRARPLYNLYAGLRGRQPLPPPGGRIRSVYASFVCVRGDDPDVFRVLLRCAHDLAAARRYAYLVVGLAGRDPLLAVAREFPHIPYRSRLYTASWDDGGDLHDRLDNRVPYVEIAAL
jgi:hypothetical protein